MASPDFALNRLLVYRSLLKNDIIRDLEELSLFPGQSPEKPWELAAKLIVWAEDIGMAGNLAENYFIYEIAKSESTISFLAEKYNGKVGTGLFKAAVQDVSVLKNIIKKDWQKFLPAIVTEDYQPAHPASDAGFKAVKGLFEGGLSPEKIVSSLLSHYAKFGYGQMACYRAFRWNSETKLLDGVKHVDSISFDDIVGYTRQKKELIANTKSFLAGLMANNVLLSGARGTGKSSSIKALINQFFAEGLRLVEISKEDFRQLPQIMNMLRRVSKKFIVFLDDLSFEEFEVEYKHLKSLIDGGISAMPENVLIYATSNRRHLIKETWNDRAGLGSDIHGQDTVNEKISLSDRFGITIYYPSPTQQEYFEIVEQLASKNNIALAKDDLFDQAIRWEMSHSGRSGRVAQQFIAYLAGQKAP